MNKKVFLHRLYHRERWRIAIFFSYDEKLKEVVKSIPGVAYSGTNRCFYVDDSEENLKLVLKALKDTGDIDISGLPGMQVSGKDHSGIIRQEGSGESSKSYNTDRHARVDDERAKSSEHIPRTVLKVESKESDKPDSGSTRADMKEVPVLHRRYKSLYGPVEFRISERGGLLTIKFLGRYDKAWVDELLTYDRCRFDKRRLEWLLPWSKMTVDSLADYFSLRGVNVNIIKQAVSNELQAERKEVGERIRAKGLGAEAREGIEMVSRYLYENRYSKRTSESYLALLEFFFRYFGEKEPQKISKEEISEFISGHIIRLGYSPAYQNQMVSAIKMYYQVAGRGRVNPELLERPRRMRALPKVLSKEEVSSILNSARNIKHKLLLWMIYSCGLRRSEVTNIRLNDLDRDRSILHIRQGKGGIDRIVPVSVMVWEKIDEYLSGYRPVEFLFEGQAGGRYSTESVYRVFKDAMQRAGIKKDIGVHSLRHSYATHLHEKGLDIRYIQELLGHKSTRTTEIYTHVSRRNLMQVRSPIEDLDLK